jgi:glycerate 2-kinase
MQSVKGRNDLSAPGLRRDARAIFSAALKAADPVEAVLRHLRVKDGVLLVDGARYRLKDYRRVLVIGAGKAGASMAKAVERLLGARISAGLVNVKYGHTARLRRIQLNECGHPVPDEAGVRGAARIAGIAQEAGEGDLVICLVSGGASALMPLPAEPITLEQKQATTKLLLACGASIHEINAIRKHISAIKGGQLARLAYPATVLSLLLSDVIGDDLDVIGSGPTNPDTATFASARGILEKYGILSRVPEAVRLRIERGERGEIPETPKPGDRAFRRTRNVIVGSNILAAQAAARRARELGYHTLLLSTFIEGETREIARMHAAIAKQIAQNGLPLKAPACIITGGETTVTLRGNGLGGRNQEFALAAALDIAGMPKVAVLSGGTDGTDGPTDAAGAVVDGGTVARGRDLGMEARAFLDANDSYHFFEKTGELLKTGPTHTNVMDIRLVMAG